LSIIKSWSFNGWIKINSLKVENGGAKFCIAFVIIESLGYSASIIFGFIGIIKCGDVNNDIGI